MDLSYDVCCPLVAELYAWPMSAPRKHLYKSLDSKQMFDLDCDEGNAISMANLAVMLRNIGNWRQSRGWPSS